MHDVAIQFASDHLAVSIYSGLNLHDKGRVYEHSGAIFTETTGDILQEIEEESSGKHCMHQC